MLYLCFFIGELTTTAPSTTRITPKQSSAAAPLHQTPATTSIDEQSQTVGQPISAQNGSYSTTTTTHQKATTSISTTQEVVKTSPKMTNQPRKTAQLGRNTASTTLQSSWTGEKRIVC